MSEAKHTPGKWSVQRPSKGETGPTRVVADEFVDGEICCLYTNPDGSTGNADLIAAAPELLEALRLVNAAPIWANPALAKIHNAVKAAIRRAETGEA